MEHDTVILASRRDVTVAQMNELLHRDPELPLPPPPKDLPLRPPPDVAASERLESEADRSASGHRGCAAARARRRSAGATARRGSRTPTSPSPPRTTRCGTCPSTAGWWGSASTCRCSGPAPRRRRRGHRDARRSTSADAARMSDFGAHPGRRRAQAARRVRPRPALFEERLLADRARARSTRPARRSSRRRRPSLRWSTPRRTCAASSSISRWRKPTTTGGAEARSRTRTHARPRRKGGRPMSAHDIHDGRTGTHGRADLVAIAARGLLSPCVALVLRSTARSPGSRDGTPGGPRAGESRRHERGSAAKRRPAGARSITTRARCTRPSSRRAPERAPSAAWTSSRSPGSSSKRASSSSTTRADSSSASARSRRPGPDAQGLPGRRSCHLRRVVPLGRQPEGPRMDHQALRERDRPEGHARPDAAVALQPGALQRGAGFPPGHAERRHSVALVGRRPGPRGHLGPRVTPAAALARPGRRADRRDGQERHAIRERRASRRRRAASSSRRTSSKARPSTPACASTASPR